MGVLRLILFLFALFRSDEEWGFCEFVRRCGSAESTFYRHRSRHVTEETIVKCKALGLNAVGLGTLGLKR